MVESELKPKQKRSEEGKKNEKAPVDLTNLRAEVRKVIDFINPNPLSQGCCEPVGYSQYGSVIDEDGHDPDND